MSKKILFTSFTTWKPHHTSNTSDDLLQRIIATSPLDYHFLRKLPVDFHLAPQYAVTKFNEIKPDIVISCGMAEERSKLHIESRAVIGDETVKTKVNLDKLTAGLTMTQISHDAGRFVCNQLYFKMLKHIRKQKRKYHCVFVHVPILTSHNTPAIVDDFHSIVNRLADI